MIIELSFSNRKICLLQRAKHQCEKKKKKTTFSSSTLQIIKKSCIEILAAEPSRVCAGGRELKTHIQTHTRSHTYRRRCLLPSFLEL